MNSARLKPVFDKNGSILIWNLVNLHHCHWHQYLALSFSDDILFRVLSCLGIALYFSVCPSMIG